MYSGPDRAQGLWLEEAARSATRGPFIPICCPRPSDLIPIVLTHYIRLNLNPLIATLPVLPPTPTMAPLVLPHHQQRPVLPGDSVPHWLCANLMASAHQTPATIPEEPHGKERKKKKKLAETNHTSRSNSFCRERGRTRRRNITPGVDVFLQPRCAYFFSPPPSSPLPCFFFSFKE